MTFSTLGVMRAGGVATISLSRPERLNAFTVQMHADLREALAALAADEACRVVVLTGEGRAFSSGQDLTEDLPRGPDGTLDLGPALTRDYNPLIETLTTYPKLTVAALNGPAVGAAMNIALACDVVVAAASAYLQEAFSKIALVPDAGGTFFLPRLVGPKRALALMLSAEPIPAPDALAMGILAKVFPDESFVSDVAAFAGKLAAGPALALKLTRDAVAESLQNDLSTQLALEADFQRRAGAHPDFLEGIAAFREKRAPRFK